MQNGPESIHILLVPTEIPCNPSEPSFLLVLTLKCLQKYPLGIPGSTFCLRYGSWDPSTPWRTELRYICKDMMVSHDNKSIYILQYNKWNNSAPSRVVTGALTRNCRKRCLGAESHSSYWDGVKKRWRKNYCGCRDGLGAAELWKKAQADLL